MGLLRRRRRSLIGRYGGFWPADRVHLPNHAPTGFFTELQFRAALSWSRWLCERNMLAKAFLNHVPAYVGAIKVQFVRRGKAPGSVPTGLGDRDGDGDVDADDVVKAAQQVWDEWCEASDWGMGTEDREKECRVRFLRDGNAIIRLGCGGRDRDHLPWTRFVEPEQIRSPGEAPEIPGYDPEDLDWTWGVCTLKRDAETVIAYWLADPDGGGG